MDNLTTKQFEDDQEIILDKDFSYEGYQVVRGEFFAHTREPGLNFSDCKHKLRRELIQLIYLVADILLTLEEENDGSERKESVCS